MKKCNAVLSLILACVLILGLCVPVSAAGNYGPDVQVDKEKKLNYPGNGNYDSDWVYWSQGASKHDKMRRFGCYAIALSKLVVEAGLKSSSEFTPDDHYRWGRDNGYLESDAAVKSSTAMIEQYTGANVTVETIDYNYSYDKVNKKVMELLNNGYYVILFRPKGNGYNKHYVYVHRGKSLEVGKTVISGSQSDIHSRTGSIYSLEEPYGFKDPLEKRLLAPLDELGYKNYITQIISVKVHSKGTGTETTNKGNDNKKSVTAVFSNYQLRVLTATSAEPYATVNSTGAKVTEVGMYIGLHENSLTKLGSDNGKAGYKKNMWYNTNKYGYPLEPGTTYYYQPYAVVGGETYKGEVQSFTTPGPKSCSHSYNSSGYCKNCGQEYPMSVASMAATTYEVVKDDVPVRDRPYAPDETIALLSAGTKVTVVASGTNSADNLWYKLDDGTWVYSKNIKEVEQSEQPADCNGNHTKGEYQFCEKLHPHERYWKCAACGALFTDGSTQELDSCEICNPKSTSVTFSNYKVRELTATSAEPYATATASSGKVARVGMMIGTSKDALTQLGTDNGTPKPLKNMWYNTTKYGYELKPGTTYYYQPFAEVNGTRYYGDIKSFTTPAK